MDQQTVKFYFAYNSPDAFPANTPTSSKTSRSSKKVERRKLKEGGFEKSPPPHLISAYTLEKLKGG